MVRSQRLCLTWFVLLSLLCLLLTVPAAADLTFGSDARSVAMGGAGLASGDTADAAVLNPAILADSGFRFGLQWPSFDARLDGASWTDVFRLIGKTDISPSDVLKLIGDASTPKQIFATGSLGVLLPYSDLLVSAQMKAQVNTRDSATPGGALSNLTPGVTTKALVTLPSIGIGVPLPIFSGTGRYRLGVRVNPVQAYYSHYIVNAGTPQLANEMANKQYLKANSISADAGLMWSPPVLSDLRVALVVNNLIEPKAIELGTFKTDVAKRTFNLGSAFVTGMFTVAADLVDLTNAEGEKAQLRTGAELRLTRLLALRGGYNTHDGFTAGVGLFGFNIAYSKNTPFFASQSIMF